MPPKRGPRTMGIYEIRNTITGQVYVGSAKVIEWRWNAHRSMLNRGNHHAPRLQRAWVKYGDDAFEFRILEVVDDARLLYSIEQAWINHMNAYVLKGGYNTKPNAVGNRGIRLTDEQKRMAAKGGKAKALPYLITFPEGKTVYIPNIAEFAEQHGLRAVALRAAARRIPAQLYRGLWVRLAEVGFEVGPPPCWRELPSMQERAKKGGHAAAKVLAKAYQVTHPDGQKEIVVNLEEFARNHDLSGHGLRRVARSPHLHTHKGYRVQYV